MISIDNLAQMIMRIAGKHHPVSHIDGPLGVRGRNSDNRLIREKLGWAPSRPLEEGIRETYKWILRQVEMSLQINKKELPTGYNQLSATESDD
jgi:GDP-D-mannose 3',5'-epimerase